MNAEPCFYGKRLPNKKACDASSNSLLFESHVAFDFVLCLKSSQSCSLETMQMRKAISASVQKFKLTGYFI